MFVVTHRRSGAFLGRVGLLEPLGWPDRELAWAIAEYARGEGFATEAANAVMHWASKRGVGGLISLIHPDNVASARVALKLSMQRTGQQFAPFGELCDVWKAED